MEGSAASYIHMVQHLIERCLIFQMTREECMEALAKHANIEPVITSTVWKELEKENKDFFAAYARGMGDRASRRETADRSSIRRMLAADHAASSSSDSDG